MSGCTTPGDSRTSPKKSEHESSDQYRPIQLNAPLRLPRRFKDVTVRDKKGTATPGG
jgi:hypothetical protein